MSAPGRCRFIAGTTAASLGLSVLFFSPKFWLMRRPEPGSFEWTRALGFLAQCRHPLTAAVEAAMRWRLLPPLVAHALGLTGRGALILPYVGLVVLTASWCAEAERRLCDRWSAFWLTLILTTTAAVISVTTLYGLNDAWFLIGLMAVAWGRGSPSLIAPALLCPWVDERFLLGWPAALFCRWWLQGRPRDFGRQAGCALAALMPYIGLRLGYTVAVSDRGSAAFVRGAVRDCPHYLLYLRTAAWMGYRAGWVLIAAAALAWSRQGGARTLAWGAACTLAGWAAVTVLASDLSRSTNLLLPLLFCGGVALKQFAPAPESLRRILAGIAVANLLMPFATVIYNDVYLSWSLPVELLRLGGIHR